MEECRIVHLKVIDSLHLSLIEPLNALAVFPESKLDFLVLGHHISPQPMLLALKPITFISALISPLIDPISMFFVSLVIPRVLSPVVPDINAQAFHIILKPLSFVKSAIEPLIDSYPRYLVLLPVARILRAVVPLEAADAMLAPLGVISFIP